ncbi:hypothetical protein IKA15_01010 [bacterium]|nr:hypothetical protein [bacterium]
MPIIALMDCNNFFASCEVLANPTLAGKAICVLSNNDGCVIARSYEAKQMGIPMGYPYFKAKVQFPNAIYISGSRGNYAEISNRIMEKIKDYSDTVEVYSIDEAFIDLTNTLTANKCTPEELIVRIKKEIKEEIGIDVSIGLAPTKTLAKFASEKAKNKSNIFQDDYPKGLYVIKEENIKEELSDAPIEDIWGIGRINSKLMHSYLIKTASDFCALNDSWIKKNMGKSWLDLKSELLGEIRNPVLKEAKPPKSIQKSASFKTFLTDKQEIKSIINLHTHRICKKLRKLNLRACSVLVFLRKKDFSVVSEKIKFKTPENSELEFNSASYKIFDTIFEEGSIYRSLGIVALNLKPEDECQINLFEQERNKKQEKLSHAWDKLEEKFGKKILRLGKY